MKPLRSEDVEVQNIKLVRIVPDQLERPDDSSPVRLSPRLLRNLPFLILVVLPSLLAVVYFMVLATSRYQSEVKFVVRTPGSMATSELASLVQGSSVMRSGDDAFIAKEYMLSRDAMQGLIDHADLRGMFDKAGLDLLWRYPLPFRAANKEGLLKHYLKFFTVEYDAGTGISTLSVEAFDPADAQRLAKALLDQTEVFINGLNARAKSDAVQSALKDVDDAKQRAYAALDKVTDFRNRETVVDPTKSSTGIVQSISQLSLETSTANARLAELAATTPQSPEITPLRNRVAALQEQITKQRQLLGGNAGSLAPRIAEYERLLLEQQFAERAFISALTSLETARLDSERQRVFLEPVTAPDLPDYPAYPYRIMSVLATMLIGFGIWRVYASLSKDVRDHSKR